MNPVKLCECGIYMTPTVKMKIGGFYIEWKCNGCGRVINEGNN